MGLPNMRFYYWGANIRSLAFWYRYNLRSDGPEWTTVELNSVQNMSLSALLGAPLNQPIPQQIKNPVIRSTMRVWTQFRRTFGFTEFSILSPVASNHLFALSQYDTSFIDWHKKGIISFSDLFEGNSFSSFEELSNKLNLPKTQFFRFLQVRNFVRHVLPGFPNRPSPNPIYTFISLNPTSKGALSTLCHNISMWQQLPLDFVK